MPWAARGRAIGPVNQAQRGISLAQDHMQPGVLRTCFCAAAGCAGPLYRPGPRRAGKSRIHTPKRAAHQLRPVNPPLVEERTDGIQPHDRRQHGDCSWQHRLIIRRALMGRILLPSASTRSDEADAQFRRQLSQGIRRCWRQARGGDPQQCSRDRAGAMVGEIQVPAAPAARCCHHFGARRAPGICTGTRQCTLCG